MRPGFLAEEGAFLPQRKSRLLAGKSRQSAVVEAVEVVAAVEAVAAVAVFDPVRLADLAAEWTRNEWAW